MVLYFPFFPSLFCGAEFTARTPVPGAPWAAGGGEGGGSREMNGERGFCTGTPQNRGSVHSLSGTARIAFHTPSALLFMESVAKLPGHPSALKPGQQDREG